MLTRFQAPRGERERLRKLSLHQLIRHPHDAVTEALERPLSPRVRLHAALMVRAVDLYHDLHLRRHEVHDVPPAEHRLPTKPDPELR